MFRVHVQGLCSVADLGAMLCFFSPQSLCFAVNTHALLQCIRCIIFYLLIWLCMICKGDVVVFYLKSL